MKITSIIFFGTAELSVREVRFLLLVGGNFMNKTLLKGLIEVASIIAVVVVDKKMK